MSSTPLVRLSGVTHDYGGQDVLCDVQLDVERGDWLGIVGPSGSGKSTLLRIMLGALAPRRGSVERASGVKVGYVPQVETVSWHFPVTVAEVVLMARTGGRRWPWPSRQEKSDVDRVLGQLGLAGLGRRHIRQLSGGQQQRVFIARALLAEPDVLFLDEPTSGVDIRTRHEVLHLLAELHEQGLTIVLTTHDLNGLAAHLPRLLCLNVAIAGLGTPGEVLTPDILERVYGAPMEVLVHAGMPLVVDRVGRHRAVVDLRRRA